MRATSSAIIDKRCLRVLGEVETPDVSVVVVLIRSRKLATKYVHEFFVHDSLHSMTHKGPITQRLVLRQQLLIRKTWLVVHKDGMKVTQVRQDDLARVIQVRQRTTFDGTGTPLLYSKYSHTKLSKNVY